MWPFKRRKYKFDLDQFQDILHNEVREHIKFRDNATENGDLRKASEHQISANILLSVLHAIWGVRTEMISFGSRKI